MIQITKTVPTKGYCTHLSSNTTIDVDYRQITMVGDPHKYATATNFYCEYSNECPNPEECPIFEKASQNYDW